MAAAPSLILRPRVATEAADSLQRRAQLSQYTNQLACPTQGLLLIRARLFFGMALFAKSNSADGPEKHVLSSFCGTSCMADQVLGGVNFKAFHHFSRCRELAAPGNESMQDTSARGWAECHGAAIGWRVQLRPERKGYRIGNENLEGGRRSATFE
ncbi:hypothetical protein Landi51_11860 [Colletotrichum acutatum]